MILRNTLMSFFVVSAAQAEPTDVPRLADGRIDLNAVYSSFRVRRELFVDGHSGQFLGEFLGADFGAKVGKELPSGSFDLTIESADLSKEATRMVALMLTDIICMSSERSSGGVEWDDTAVQHGAEWTVTVSCKPREIEGS